MFYLKSVNIEKILEFFLNYISIILLIKIYTMFSYFQFEFILFISIIALAKLLQFAVNNNDSRFNEIEVTGDEIIDNSGVRTRAQRSKGELSSERIFIFFSKSKIKVDAEKLLAQF